MKNNINVYDVATELIGSIEPVGSTHIDNKIFDNLTEAIHLTNMLIDDIILVARHKVRAEHSMKITGEEADMFITKLRQKLTE